MPGVKIVKPVWVGYLKIPNITETQHFKCYQKVVDPLLYPPSPGLVAKCWLYEEYWNCFKRERS